MRSDANNTTLLQISARKYFYKLRAYSVYFSSLVLAQVLAGLLLAFGTNGGAYMNNSFLSVSVHTFSAQIVLMFSVCWAGIISVQLAGRKNTEASFSLPGNRLSAFLSDLAYILTGCLFGAVTTALFNTAIRTVAFAFFSRDVIARGFHPAAADLLAVGAATFLSMLLASAAGYFSGTLFRISKIFIVVIAAIFGSFLFIPITQGTMMKPLWEVLFGGRTLASFALAAGAVSVLAFALCAVILNRMEVRR